MKTEYPVWKEVKEHDEDGDTVKLVKDYGHGITGSIEEIISMCEEDGTWISDRSKGRSILSMSVERSIVYHASMTSSITVDMGVHTPGQPVPVYSSTIGAQPPLHRYVINMLWMEDIPNLTPQDMVKAMEMCDTAAMILKGNE